MLPDLRIVIAAVVSTFIFTVGVGFFASSRLIHEQMTTRVDTKGFDDTPINRIALNWPEPTKTERNIDLDFAISAKGSGNPVRELTPDLPQAETQPLQPPKTEEPSSAPPEPETLAQAKNESRDPEPVIAVANAPDPVEDKLPEPAAVQDSATETRVTVQPNDTPPVESTGSIAAPAPATPDIPIPEERPKFAARPEPSEAEPAAKPASTESGKTTDISQKRPKKAAVRQRPPARSQTLQTQQVQPFNFFGLFRAPPATLRLPPQVAAPTTPIN